MPERDLPLSPDGINALQDELLRIFSTEERARTFLRHAGFPPGLIPEWHSGYDFWGTVFFELGNGAMETPYRRLISVALRQFRSNEVLQRLLSADGPPASPGLSAPGPPASARPLRVLVIGASPSDMPPVRADRESRAIAKAAIPGSLDVDDVPGAEATDLENVRSFRPDILHFICHGEEDSLVFNDVRGESDPVKAGRIADTLRFYQQTAGVRLRGIVLAACDGETVAPFLASVADTVIAHRGKLSDPCGVAFATQLYRRLNETDDLAAAAREAAQLTAQFSDACDSVIESLIVLPGGG